MADKISIKIILKEPNLLSRSDKVLVNNMTILKENTYTLHKIKKLHTRKNSAYKCK